MELRSCEHRHTEIKVREPHSDQHLGTERPAPRDRSTFTSEQLFTMTSNPLARVTQQVKDSRH
jgi:hypothetical protein